MFHRPVGLSSVHSNPSANGNNTHAALARGSRSSLLTSQNENSGLSNTNKTPAKSSSATRPRRAFGDISNKKAPDGNNRSGNGNGKDGGGSGGSGNGTSLVLKPRSVNVSSATLTPRNVNCNRKASGGSSSNSNQYESRIPKPGGTSISKRSHPWSRQQQQQQPPLGQPIKAFSKAVLLPVAATSKANHSRTPIPVKADPTPRRQAVDFAVPSRQRASVPFGGGTLKPNVGPSLILKKAVTASVSSTLQPKPSKVLEPVDDIELPAGRLWEDQLKYDDPLGEDDDISTSSMGETLDRRTMWDDWKDTMRRQLDAQDVKLLHEEEDRRVQQQIEKVMRQDEHETGLESLLDWVDDLDRSNKSSDSANLDALLEDDDWSEPASSIDGTLGLGSDDGIGFDLQ